MKHPILLLFVVLATISVINAIPHGLSKRTTQFIQCTNGNVPPLSVTITPDPMVSGQDVTYNISGTAPIDFTEATVEIDLYDGQNYAQSFTGNFCDIYKQCPVKNGTNFDFPFTIKPENLPQTYFIDVLISNSESDLLCVMTS